MTKTETTTMRKVSVGERVTFKADGSKGTITEVGYAAIKIAWDDGETTIVARADLDGAIEAPTPLICRDCHKPLPPGRVRYHERCAMKGIGSE